MLGGWQINPHRLKPVAIQTKPQAELGFCSFSPDATFYTGQPTGGKFLNGAPVFAVEVTSENDYGNAAEKDIAAKRRDYFAANTLVVWDVDVLKEEVVRVYRASNPTSS
ncbi:MAG: Uma2 family endonuclease [Heteroscytonema crispum UTEX LB 1556]